MSLYIFDILFYYLYLCTTFLCPLRFCWLLVLSLYKEDYLQILNACPFDNTAVAVSRKDVRTVVTLLTVLSRSAIVLLSKFW